MVETWNQKAFGVNAEQKYLLHLQNINRVTEIYKLVEADTEYIDLLAKPKIEEVEGWGCRLLFTQPKKGLDHNTELSVHNKASGFERNVKLAYVDIPCKIDKVYYDNVHHTRWIDALGDSGKVIDIENQLKENISTEITEDINVAVEDALANKKNYKLATDADLEEVSKGTKEADGNAWTITKDKMTDTGLFLDLIFNISSKFRSRNTTYQKGYYADATKGMDDKDAWQQIQTNTPSLKRVGVIIDSVLMNKFATTKYADAFNVKFIELKERFAYVKETNFKNVLQDGKTHDDYKGYNRGGTYDFDTVYAKEKLMLWMGDVRVPVLKIREPKEGLEYKYEVENGLHWFFHKSRVYVGIATCLNYIGIFAKTA